MAGKGNRIKQKRISYSGRGRILKKEHVWVYSTRPGPHKKNASAAIGVVLRDLLKVADNTREVKYILHNKEVLVNNRRVKDYRFPIGLFDILELKDLNKKYRVWFDNKGYLDLKELDKKDKAVRVSKVLGKTDLGKDKVQLNLDNGYNVLVKDHSYKVKDSVVLDLEKGKILEVLPFKEGANIFVINGPHTGKIGQIKEIVKGSLGKKEEVVIKGKDEFRTISEYVVVIPEDFK